MAQIDAFLRLKWLGINTYKEPVIYMREDCHICRSEGFEAQARVQVTLGSRSVIATLNTVDSNLLHANEASLSDYAWEFLQAKEGEEIYISHPKPIDSISYIRSKLYGNALTEKQTQRIIEDILAGQLSDIHIAMYLAGTIGTNLNQKEILDLTRAMVETGQKITWPSNFIVDKHCVGGLPGNRTTLIVVPIVAAYGLMIPKTSSRAITSPAGTADTMEVFAPVNLDIKTMRNVVERENGCIIWGGSVSLSPVDDLLIRIERTMNLDSEGQMVASILSKKIAAGSTHIVIDMPIGPTAKVRTNAIADMLKLLLEYVAKAFSIQTKIIYTDGMQPVGRGIGPTLEAKDVLEVLTCAQNAPADLRERALSLAGEIIEFSSQCIPGEGKNIAQQILDSGKAFEKFQAICHAQGGFFSIPSAPFTHVVQSKRNGTIIGVDNRNLARIAKLAGAPRSKVAGLELCVTIGTKIEKHQPLFIVHAESKGQLEYALSFLEREHSIFSIEENI